MFETPRWPLFSPSLPLPGLFWQMALFSSSLLLSSLSARFPLSSPLSHSGCALDETVRDASSLLLFRSRAPYLLCCKSPQSTRAPLCGSATVPRAAGGFLSSPSSSPRRPAPDALLSWRDGSLFSRLALPPIIKVGAPKNVFWLSAQLALLAV